MNYNRNDEVALAWAQGRPARNHTGSFHTNGKQIYSYELQIGDTDSVGLKVLRDYTANGTYGFRSMTTSQHVGKLRCIPGHEIIII